METISLMKTKFWSTNKCIKFLWKILLYAGKCSLVSLSIKATFLHSFTSIQPQCTYTIGFDMYIFWHLNCAFPFLLTWLQYYSWLCTWFVAFSICRWSTYYQCFYFHELDNFISFLSFITRSIWPYKYRYGLMDTSTIFF